jgi:hypothetical protein
MAMTGILARDRRWMGGASIRVPLVVGRHVDLGRVRSAACPQLRHRRGRRRAARWLVTTGWPTSAPPTGSSYELFSPQARAHAAGS